MGGLLSSVWEGQRGYCLVNAAAGLESQWDGVVVYSSAVTPRLKRATEWISTVEHNQYLSPRIKS